MKTINRIGVAIGAACLVVSLLTTGCEDKPRGRGRERSSDTRDAEPGNISPEMRVLATRIGVWDTETGITTTRWVLDGKGQISEHANRPTGPDAVFLVMYDADKKTYHGWRADDQGEAFKSTGTWDPNTKTLTWTWKGDNGVTFTAPEHLDDADAIPWEFTAKDNEGNVVSKGGGKATRRK